MEAKQLPEDFKDFIRFLNKNDVEISLIFRSDFILNKKASGRLQDLADIEKLS